MPCYHPLKGYRALKPNENGKYPLTFNLRAGYHDMPVTVPCGQCIGCRLERSRQWAVRCLFEAQLHDDNCFITLTYDDEHLPPDQSLSLLDFQLFFKRLRKRFGSGIRFLHCGEYGELNLRPHYHALIFGFDFPDKIVHRKDDQGYTIWTSEILSKLWPHGLHEIGSLTFDSAAYVARYVTKKVTGAAAEEHYQSVNLCTGEVIQRKPEYITMSRRPGIGSQWFDKYKSDVYPHDFVVVNGKRVRPPKYFDNLLEKEAPDQLKYLKYERVVNAQKNIENNTLRRLEDREICHQARIKSLKREL